MYCRKCAYDLRGSVTARRCPECGQAFAPENPRSFTPRPPHGPWWRWTKRLAITLLGLGIVLAATWGYLYWDWRREQAVVAKLKANDDVAEFTEEPLGGKQLQGYLGPTGWVLERVRTVTLGETPDADLVYLREFKGLQVLRLYRAQITDVGLVRLRELKGLRMLDLSCTRITDAGLVHLRELKGLQVLGLFRTRITDAGLVHLRELKGLQNLTLSYTRITDGGLVHLREFKGLQMLYLPGTRITDAGRRELQAALPRTNIYWTPPQVSAPPATAP